MRGVVLACGSWATDVAGTVPGEIVHVAHRPGKSDVDAVLARIGVGEGDGADLIVAGDDADLAAVVVRLLRTDRLARTTVGYLPARGSVAAKLWGIPTEWSAAYRLATTGTARPVPLIRDDKGGVLLGRGTFAPVSGVGYCDDDVVLRGYARRLDVQPDLDGGPGLVIAVRLGRLRRRMTTTWGRAFQLGCDPAFPVLDGARRERPVDKWTWYRHTEDLRVVRA